MRNLTKEIKDTPYKFVTLKNNRLIKKANKLELKRKGKKHAINEKGHLHGITIFFFKGGRYWTSTTSYKVFLTILGTRSAVYNPG